MVLAQNLIPLKFRQRFMTATSPCLPCAGSPGTIDTARQVTTPKRIEGKALCMDRARAVMPSAERLAFARDVRRREAAWQLRTIFSAPWSNSPGVTTLYGGGD